MNEKETRIAKYTGKVTGATATSFITSAIGGLPGVAIAAGVDIIVEENINDFISRGLSQKENERILNVTTEAINKINDNIIKGEELRDDGFISQSKYNSGKEIFEGLLTVSQREYENKKIQLLGRLYANILFSTDISKPMANSLLKVVDSLTYRQLLILKWVGKLQIEAENGKNIRLKQEYKTVEGYDMISVASEVYDLYNKGLISSSVHILDPASINPSLLKVAGNGALLYNNMELSTIKYCSDEDDIVVFLTGCKPYM